MRMADHPISAVLALVVLGTICVLLWCPYGVALDTSPDVSQYAHKAWTYRDGFLQGSVFAITQTPDGYLWLATRSGVVRFDGVRLVPLPLPPGQQLPSSVVSALLTARDGTLWIGTLNGLVNWNNGQMTEHPTFARHTIRALLQDRDGTLWVGGFVGSTGMLCAIRGGSTTCDGDDGSFGSAVTSLFEDPNGTLWVGASTGVWRWRPGARTRYPAPQPAIGRANVPPVQGVPLFFTSGRVLHDRNGGMWVAAGTHGLVYSHEGTTSTFTQADGLSSDVVYNLLEDREGTIWVATSDGLDRFRELPVTSVSVKQGLSSGVANSVLAARDGSVWIGTTDGLTRWKDGRTTIYRRRSNPGIPNDNIDSTFEDERGRIWLSSPSGLAVFEKGKFTAVPSVPAVTNNATVGDSHGGLWLSLWGAPTDGLAHLVDGKIVEQVSWQKLGGGPGTGLVADPQGGIWTGLLSGGLAYFRAGEIRNLPLSDDGAGVRRVLEVSRDRDGSIWAATENGLSRIKNGQVRTLTTANGLPCKTVHWIIEDDVSSYWVYTECGLLRVARTDMEAWTADPSRVIRPTTFDAVDGVQLVPILNGFRPAVTKSSDGKIWFLNGGGTVSFIDPSRISINALPPPTHIEQITADGKTYDATSGLRLPPRVRNLTINYTALSMVAPERMHFRFKLEGQDSDWREVVNDRRVQYSNLPPRNYRFRVIASNNSGVWNEQGDMLEFSVAPAYYQAKWFRALCAIVFLTLLWVAYQLRVRQLAHHFNLTCEVRVAERTRIARDLHDTLLQSFQALLPRLQTAIYKLPEGAADARKTLEETVDRASDAITEGRDAVQGLRMSTVEKNDLALAIRTVGEELTSAETNLSSPKFNVVVEGTSRNLHPILRDEVYRLAAEALRNAFRHSAAQNVEVAIRYDEKYFRLRVRDDGKGIGHDVLSGDRREGHYGLHGMRERAKLVGGKLTIWSEVDSGTEIELMIPASRAYGKSTRPFWYFRKRPATDTNEKETIDRE